MTASDANAPYLSVFTHAGSPWSDITTHLRLGNLNGFLGYSTDLYGIGIGTSDSYFKYDPSNGVRLKGDITITGGNAAVTFYQATEPTSGMKSGDYWIDSDDNSLHVYQGSWVLVAASGVKVFTATPTTPYHVGDLWLTSLVDNVGDLKKCVLERLTGAYVASDWLIATEYTDDTVANAQKARLDDIVSDAKITPVEKLIAKQIWDAIVVEGTATTGTIPVQAIALSVPDTDFDTAYAALDLYLNTTLAVFGDMTDTTNITRSTWDTKWNDYYNQRTLLIDALAAKAATTATWSGISSVPAMLAAPSGDGLYLSSTYMGFYKSSAWKTYIDNSGNFVLGDIAGGNTGLAWNQSAGTLGIIGNISASTIDIGGADATSFHVDVNGNVWAGAATYDIATNPFAVSNAGLLRAVSGSIGGWSLSATAVYYDGATDATSAGMAPADYPFYAGKKYADRSTAPFRVTPAGALYASSAEISGKITTGTGSVINGTYIDSIAAGKITAGIIDASIVTINNLTVGTNVGIGTAQTAGQVTTIVGNTVTTSFVNALSVTAGSVAAENITGTVITGRTLRTAAVNNNRISIMSSSDGSYPNQITFHDSSNYLVGSITNDYNHSGGSFIFSAEGSDKIEFVAGGYTVLEVSDDLVAVSETLTVAGKLKLPVGTNLY
jgi:hypothetical protein